MIDGGAQATWSSPALSYLTSAQSDIPITVDQAPWLASICSISSIIGFLTYPLIMNRIGRKYTILVFGLTQVTSRILLNLASSYTFLCIARVVVGTGYGGTYAILTIYIGEVAEKRFRGMFLSLDKICVNLGAFLINAAGAFLSYKTMNLIMILIPLIALGTFPFMLETPYFYLLKGRDEEAIKTLMVLSRVNRPELIMEDIERMKKNIEECKKSKNSSIKELFSDRGSRKALMIKFLTEFIYSFSGFLAIQAYAQQIFSNSGSNLGPAYEAMIMTGVQVLAGFPSSQLVDHWGRRPVYLFSGLMSAIMLGITGLFFFFKFVIGTDLSNVTWIPLVSMVLYMVVCNMGLTTIPYIYSGELFSVKVKGLAVMLSVIISGAFGFITKLMLPFLNEAAGIYTTFWIFAFTCVVGSLIIYYITPETKGKNLERILEILSGKKT